MTLAADIVRAPGASGGAAFEQAGPAEGARRKRRYAVIVVHYRTPGMLADCLATLLPELDPARDVVVVVDNASGEAHLPALRRCVEQWKQKEVALLESAENVGFAGANNLGIGHVLAEGGAEYFVLLNPDTLIRPGAFGGLRKFLDEHPEAALVGPRLEYPDGSPQLSAFGDPTPVSELVRGANIGILSRLLKRWEVYGAVRETPHRADWLAGACVMMRAAVIERTGLLDSGFFMYFEEVDYFRRARRLGFQAWYEPAAHVVHLVGQSSGVTSDWSARRLPAYWFESRHRYFRKHFGYLGTVAADAAWLVGHALMRLRRLLTGVSHSAIARQETRDFVRHSWRHATRPGRIEAAAAVSS